MAHADHLSSPCQPAYGAVVYTQPVVYQAPVVYHAPVVYNAPVYYHGAPSAYSQVVYSGACQSPNVIIAGRGAYRASWNTSPTVIYFGGGHASHGMLPNRRYR